MTFGPVVSTQPLARAARGRVEMLERIWVSRALSCYQMLTMLETLPTEPVPVPGSDISSKMCHDDTHTLVIGVSDIVEFETTWRLAHPV